MRDVLLASSLIDAIQTAQRFTPQTSASGEARRFVRDTLDGEGTDLIATAELLVSELVANAVEHAASAPDVNVVVLDQAVRIEVFDDDDSAAPTMQAHAPMDPSGRGLSIVDRRASRWSTEQVGTAKIIWFELDRPVHPPS